MTIARILELRRRFESVAEQLPRRARQIAFMIASAALVVALGLHSRSLLTPLGHLRRPDPGPLTVAVAAEVASLFAYALIVRDLLALGGVSARLRPLLRATVGGIAMGASLPGGQAASAAYWYRQLRQEGVEAGLVALGMVGSMLAGIASLAVLFALGVALAGGSGPLAGARVPVLAAAAALLVLRLLFSRRLGRVASSLLRRLAPSAPDGLTLGRKNAVVIAVYAYANWLLDCGSLYASLAAVHANVPPRSVLLTYALSQLVSALPLLPGGGGTVELSLTFGFAAFGHTSGNVLAGVLLFRLISCWGLVPVGWLAVALGSRPPGPRSEGRRGSPCVAASPRAAGFV